MARVRRSSGRRVESRTRRDDDYDPTSIALESLRGSGQVISAAMYEGDTQIPEEGDDDGLYDDFVDPELMDAMRAFGDSPGPDPYYSESNPKKRRRAVNRMTDEELAGEANRLRARVENELWKLGHENVSTTAPVKELKKLASATDKDTRAVLYNMIARIKVVEDQIAERGDRPYSRESQSILRMNTRPRRRARFHRMMRNPDDLDHFAPLKNRKRR